MNSSRKLQLRMEAQETGLNPSKVTLSEGRIVRNAEKTGDDKAAAGGSWKGFWQLFAADDFPTKCPFCGEKLNENDIDGCHINIRRINLFNNTTYYSSTKYIIPGHHDCNMKLGKEFSLETPILAIEAKEKK